MTSYTVFPSISKQLSKLFYYGIHLEKNTEMTLD